MEKIRKLSTAPYSHEVFHEISKGDITYRRSLQWSYRIIFAIYEEEQEAVHPGTPAFQQACHGMCAPARTPHSGSRFCPTVTI
jgi:hypothetical protein